MRSKSTTGTLVRQPLRVQTYFGVLPGTYILAPQWQKVSPPKSCTARLGAGVRFARRSASMLLAAFQSSSGTMGSMGVSTHSVAGFRVQPLPSARERV